MLVALVILVFFVGAFLGSVAMALVCAANNREKSLRLDAG